MINISLFAIEKNNCLLQQCKYFSMGKKYYDDIFWGTNKKEKCANGIKWV